MLVSGETLLFSPRGMVTAIALKWSGTSVTVGNLVAAITVRVIADGAGLWVDRGDAHHPRPGRR
jgi:hypothetical protein